MKIDLDKKKLFIEKVLDFYKIYNTDTRKIWYMFR